MAELNVTLQELRGKYKEFTAKNPILMNGQLAVVTIETGDSVEGFIAPSTGLKCGDGKTAFKNLTWLAGREQLINTGSTASNAILHKQNQELYMTRSEFDKLDKTTLPVGTEINIVDQIQKQDLATDIQKSLTNADTALTNANTALSTANNALPKSGGTITGNLVVSGNETLNGALTVSGTTTFSNTTFTAGSVVKRVNESGDEIGVVQFRHIEEAAVPFGTLESGYDYRIGDADMLEWYFPETNIPSDFYAIMRFNSGTTATTILIDEDCVLTGDDCKGGIFTPVANKKYSVFVWYDGTKQGVVRSIPTDGKWEDGTITIGSSTETSPAELKKVVYCPSASVPATPEVGVEYALTDLIGEEDLNSALQTKINSFATKTEVNAVSTVANNALPKSGGAITGNLTVDGTLSVQDGVNDGDAASLKQLNNALAEVQQQLEAQLNTKTQNKRDLIKSVIRGQTVLYSAKGTGDLLNSTQQTSTTASVSPIAGSVPLRNDSGAITTLAAVNDNECVNKEQMNTALADKANIIEKPASNALLYGVDSTATDNQPVGFVASQTSVTKGTIPLRKANGQIQAPNQIINEPLIHEYISRYFADNNYLKAIISSCFCKHTAGSYGVTMTRATSSSDTGTDKIRDQSLYIIQAYKQDGNLTDFTINASKTVSAKMALIFCDTGDSTLGFAFTGSALITDVAKSVSRIQSIVPPSGARLAYYRVALDNESSEGSSSGTGGSGGTTVVNEAKWRYDASDASNTNPVKFIKFNSTFFDTSYCYNTVLSEILVGVRPSYLSGVASQMVRHQSNGNLIFVSVEYSTETDGSLSSCTVSCFDTNQNTDMGSATYTKGSGWSGDGYLTVSVEYYY